MENKKEKIKEIKALDYLWLALYAFLGLGLEIVIMFGETYIYGLNPGEWGMGNHIMHWFITCIVWGSFSYFLIKSAKNKYAYDLLQLKEKPTKYGMIVTVIVTVVGLIIMNASWDGFKVVIEYQEKGPIRFIFQYIYYIFEVGLITLIMVFGQKFGEMLTKRKTFIWGGIVLSLTWGLVHILTQDFMTGMLTVVLSLLFSIIHLSLKKNLYLTYLFIAIIFIL